jgi:hypothetical protein
VAQRAKHLRNKKKEISLITKEYPGTKAIKMFDLFSPEN